MVSNTCETKQPYNAKQCICESKSVFYNYFPKCVSDHPGRLTYLFQFFPLSFEFALIFFRWLVPPFIYILHWCIIYSVYLSIFSTNWVICHNRTGLLFHPLSAWARTLYVPYPTSDSLKSFVTLPPVGNACAWIK